MNKERVKSSLTRHCQTLTQAQQLFTKQGFYFPCRAFSPNEASELLTDYYDFRETARKTRSLEVLHGIFKPHLLALWADRIVHSPTILDVVESFIGSDLLAWSVDIFVRSAAGGSSENLNSIDPNLAPSNLIAPKGLAWHQDSPYLGLMPLERIVRAWVALTPAETRNGTMRYLPGSHLQGQCEHQYLGHSPEEITRGQQVRMSVDEASAVAVELLPGEFSVHDIRTVHDSGENQTDKDRVCIAITYIAPDVEPLFMRDSAMLVRGWDKHHYYELEQRPKSDFHPQAIESYASAIAMRLRRLRHLPNAF